MTILTVDRAMPTIRKIGDFARTRLLKVYNFTVRGIDLATGVIGRVSTYAAVAIPRVRTFTIRAINMASSVIGSVKRALFSIPAMITVTLAVLGAGKLKDATVGSAMNFEGYNVSMEHWLGGNTKQAKELVTWMGQLADATPFSSVDLFPALTRGVGLADGDVKQAQKLLRLSADMAALTPNRSVEDAMEALGSAQMGDFTMLKGFNLKVTQDDFKDMGGFDGLIDELTGKFDGGAAKLSKTSAGILATLRGYRSSIMRSMGEGFLEPMKPRLEAIGTWLDNNQETWARWKNNVKQIGGEASEWVFSKLEKGFLHIKNNYLNNKDFMDLDFEGKINFISEDIGQWWSSKGKPALSGWWDSSGKPWAEKIGLFMGESIFNGIVLGIKEGGKALGGMWKDAFKDPSLGAFGGAGVATMIAGMLASVVLSPILTALGVIKKIAWDLPKKAISFFGKGENAPKAPKTKKPPKYKSPWFSRGETPTTKTPNAKVPKMPKALMGLGKFAKRIPVLGTAIGALAILSAKKEDKAGAVGGVGGGIGGAAIGAAIGSVVPGLGTAIGGIVGGIAGSIGGGALGDWLSSNWSSIKEGASNTGKWISEKFNESISWVKDAWSTSTAWFSESIWTPLTEGFNTALNFIVGLYDIAEEGVLLAWGFVTEWFSENVWTPLTTAAGLALDWVGEKFDLAWLAVTTIWGLAWTWFEETVWTPIKTGVELVGSWIAEKFNLGWTAITEVWSLATGWFEETIWSPISIAAEVLGNWIGDKFTEGWGVVTDVWGVASGYFEENIWSPIKSGAESVKDGIMSAFGSAWEYVSGIFTKLGDTWDTIKDWGGSAASYITNRGAERRGQAPSYATGTNFHPGGPAILGDGGGPELYRYPNGGMGLSPGTDTMMNLPRGTEVLSHRNTIKYFGNVPAYADGVGFDDTVSNGQLNAATTSSGKRTISEKVKEIVIQITGDNNFFNDTDMDDFKRKVVQAVTEALEEEDFETGGLVIDG